MFSNKIKNVDDFWKWMSGDFLDTLKLDSSFRNSSEKDMFKNEDLFLNEPTSILIGFPILRQIRLRKGLKFEIDLFSSFNK